MAQIAPVDYERYAVLIAPSVIPTRVPSHGTPELRVPEEIDPKTVDYSLHEGPPFNSKAELAVPPPVALPAATSGHAALASTYMPPMPPSLNPPPVLPTFMAGKENTPSPSTVTGLYEKTQETLGKTVNLRG